MPQGDQVKNGKAFEYSLAYQYYVCLKSFGKNVELVENSAIDVARGFYQSFANNKREEFDEAARQTIDTMLKIEPGLLAQKGNSDKLFIALQNDSEGAIGDVRDIVFHRLKPSWEIGFSAKNNNDAVKHSRLSRVLDFGKEWLGCPCSISYWEDIRPIFAFLGERAGQTFNSLGEDKVKKVYVPLLTAFRNELMRIYENNSGIPEKLIRYLIGNYAFYKIIKDDSHNLVIVKAFNINNELSKTVNGIKAKYKTPVISLPTRIVEFDFKRGAEDNTLDMILDGGWEISFRIHNASSNVEQSLKFDIRLLGNPPVLFTQHLFR
jgi:hypothetical protein